MSVAVDSAIDTVAAAAAAYTVPRVVALLDEKTCVGAAVTECVLDIGVEDERVWDGDDALVDGSHPCRDRAVVKAH